MIWILIYLKSGGSITFGVQSSHCVTASPWSDRDHMRLCSCILVVALQLLGRGRKEPILSAYQRARCYGNRGYYLVDVSCLLWHPNLSPVPFTNSFMKKSLSLCHVLIRSPAFWKLFCMKTSNSSPAMHISLLIFKLLLFPSVLFPTLFRQFFLLKISFPVILLAFLFSSFY